MAEGLRCFVCGREGTRQFRRVPELTVDLLKRYGGGTTVVGGWDECANKDACRRRVAKQSVGRPETEYP